MKLSRTTQLLLIILIILAAYYPIIHSGFAPIDDQSLVNKLLNRDTYDLKALFLPGGGYYYRPLTILTFFLDTHLWGLEPSFMHLENVLLHLLNALLMFGFFTAVCHAVERAPGKLPLAAALLFALHPINTESVCWISGRTDVLAGAFLIGALWALVKALHQKTGGLMVFSIGLFVLACMAKETAIFFVGGAVLIVVAFKLRQLDSLRKALMACIVPTILWFTGAFAYLGWRSFALGRGDSGVRTAVRATGLVDGQADYLDKLRIALKVAGFYLKKIFLPWPLNFGIINMSDAYVALGVLLLLLIAYLLWSRTLAAALFLTSFCLGLATLLVVFSQMAWTPIAERYLYLPAITFVPACLLVWMQKVPRHHNKLPAIVMTLVLAGLAIFTNSRARTWSDPIWLMEDTVRKSPEFVPAKNTLAVLKAYEGNIESALELLDGTAEQVGERNYSAVDVNRAMLLAKEGDFEQASEILRERLKDPGKNFIKVADTLIEINLQWLGQDLGEAREKQIREQNVDLLERILKKKPYQPFLHYRLAKAYLANGQREQAKTEFLYAYEKAPRDAYYRAPAGKLYQSLDANSARPNSDSPGREL